MWADGWFDPLDKKEIDALINQLAEIAPIEIPMWAASNSKEEVK